MSKRFAVFSLVFLVSAIAVTGYFLHQGRKTLLTDPYKAVRADAGIIIETIDLRSFINSVTTGKGLFSEINNIRDLSTFSFKLRFLADQINSPAFGKLLQEGASVISFHPGVDGKLIPFLSKAVPAEAGFRMLKEAFGDSGFNAITEKKSGGRRIIAVPFTVNDSKDTLFSAIGSGLLLASTSETLVTESLFQVIPGTDIRNVPGFARIHTSSGKNEDKIFLIFSNLKETFRKIFADAGPVSAERISKAVEMAGGDIYFTGDGLSVSGYIEPGDEAVLLTRLKSVQPIELETYKILPSATAMFESMILVPDNIVNSSSGTVPEVIENLASRLRPYLGNEITKAYIDIKNVNPDQNSAVIYKLGNRAACENIFSEIVGSRPDLRFFRPDDQTRIPVYTTGSPGLLPALVRDFSPDFEDSYFAFYDNYLISGNSYATVSKVLYDNMLNKTLANDILYREFEKLIPSRVGYVFYCVPSRCLNYFLRYFRKEVGDGLRSNKSSLDKIQSAGFQLASVNGMLYSSFSVSYMEKIREESVTEWETLLDTTAGIKPFFFTNHNTGAKEIFVQDTKNNAYLINSAGRVLWKVPLRERISGSVYMIDYYRNGKYQLLFSGRNYLHLVDRNGNYVERYPVRLRSPATNSVALFDYENNGTYRLVIAGEDKQVYLYDKSGNVVKGWEPFRTAGFVGAEAGFYKVSGKDFIVVADESSLYYLDRSGKIRLRLKESVTKAKGSSLRLSPGSDPSLVCSSPEGTVNHISFNGDVRKLTFREFTFDHSFDFFDIDGDGFGEYIFLDKGILYLYDHNMKEMFTRDFGSARLGGPINFIFSSSDRKIGVVDTDKNLIYLTGSNGEIMDGFPLRGASMFSIGKLSAGSGWNLIVGGTDRFMYNYKLDTSPR